MTPPASPQVVSRPRRAGISVGAGAGAVVVAIGWTIGLRSLADNSFLTHLATGRLILDTGSVPSADPYTFTAQGEPWVVQSWLASVVYATVEALTGATGLRILMGLIAAALAAVGWTLTRPARALLPRLAIGALFVAVGAGLWAERPLMLGLLGLGVTALAVEGRLDARWLVPVGWLWVNSHGSFPLGIAYVVVVLAGLWLDHEDLTVAWRALRWLVLGIVLGAIGPLGPKVLLFPVELLGQQDILKNVVEWRAPTFQDLSQRAFILQMVLAVVAVVRRPTYRHGLVVGVFVAAALLGARNIPVASLLLLPVLADAAPEVGTLRTDRRDRLAVLLAAGGVVAFVLMTSMRLGQPDFQLRRYPIDALAFVQATDVDLDRTRLAAPDIVGNVQEVLFGANGTVFYDDRFDMFPADVSNAHLALVNVSATADDHLEEQGVDLVLWSTNSATSRWLTADAAWRSLYVDERWTLFCRRDVALSEAVTC